MSLPLILTITGLSLNVIGALLLLSKPATKWFRSHFNQHFKEEIENEAITTAWNRLAPSTREEQLADSIARGFISTYRTSFFSFLFLLIGFILQLAAQFFY